MDGDRTTDRAGLVARVAAALALLALAGLATSRVALADAEPQAGFHVDGFTGYAEPAPTERPTNPAPPLLTQSLEPPVTRVPELSSRPGATHTIYLDFDGHRVSHGAWVVYNGGRAIDAPPFDRDGRPGSFDGFEQDAIRQVWEAVAEDYAPFDVDVTTVDPGVERLAGRSLGGSNWGVRVVVTAGWVGSSAGLALVGTFGRGDPAPGTGTATWSDIPVWVFADRLYHDPDDMALAASHEAGHSFGLHHDDGQGASHCRAPEYYCGHAPPGVWAPIMGAGYNRAVTQWSRGEYTGATNLEDDVARIEAMIGLAADDHGDTPETATSLGSGTDTVVGTLAFGDVDQFTVAVGAGRLDVALGPANGRSGVANLFARLDVFGPGGLVASSTPASPLAWSAGASVNVAPGTYRIVVTPIGYLSPDTGFPAYASAGRYRLDVASSNGVAVPTQSDRPPVGTAGVELMTPVRVLDTRTPSSPGRLADGAVVRIDLGAVSGRALTAAMLNLTAVAPSEAGYLAVGPCAAGRPPTSTVNFAAQQTVANTTVAAVDASGAVCVYARGATDVVIDATGWLHPAATNGLVLAEPARLADTRRTGRLPAGGVLEVELPGDAPVGVSGVAVNVAAVGPTGAGHLTAYPCESARPVASIVNYTAGQVRANNAVLAAPGGRLCVYTHAAADVVVDLMGYVGAQGLRFAPAGGVRLTDSRHDGAPLPAGGVRAVPTPASPTGTARAAAVNVVAVDHVRAGYVTAFDCAPVPATSTVNHVAGEAAANGAHVALDAGGRFCLRSSHGGHVIADLAGWWVTVKM